MRSLCVWVGAMLCTSLACSSAPAVVMVDAGVVADTGIEDADAEPDDLGIDAGPIDPCAADRAHAMETLFCNGPAEARAPNAFGGACTRTAIDEHGTCMDETASCYSFDGMSGYCRLPCNPLSNFVATGGCPSGSRCFSLGASGGFGACFPDCASNSDCADGSFCDGAGSCEPGAP